ncbi:hypothetical protein HF086_016366 [Spodoptera exigua]|uniref:Uncharacterized protein n=1 Tax=Spodoptera exigua TaxID=7107 RepID=A0A922SJB1_SPOEX|nr:hypothetical protein HF086_016366 [Spodoptera exigua]
MRFFALLQFCPETNLRKDDSCSLVTSISGLRYMFTQSRYTDLEKNLPRERRPAWFLKNYFDKNCCDLPVIFNTTVLEECGFSSVMNYIDHGLKQPYPPSEAVTLVPLTTPGPITTTDSGDTLKIVDLNTIQETSTSATIDPMECCDMEGFIKASWKSECNFHLKWGGKERLVVSQPPATEPPTTTTERTEAVQDIMLVPHSCEKETCVFRNLGIVKGTEFNTTAFLLEVLTNFTHSHPAWELPIQEEVGSLQNRREICLLPELVHHDYLYGCGLDAIYKVEHVAVPVRRKKHVYPSIWHNCKQLQTQTTCVMDKLGVLNRYKFMDYFRMKEKIREFTEDKPEWSAMMDIYTTAFISLPMYSDHCNSERKLLNVIDAMLMTCPVSKRKNTPQCNSIFMEMIKATPVDKQNLTKEKTDQVMKHYHHVFMPTRPRPPRVDVAIRKKHTKYVTPAFQFGILNSKNAPPVRVTYVKPPLIKVRPLILQPVYLRPSSFIHGRVSDGVFRNNPFWLHDQILKGQMSTTTTRAPTVSTSSSPVLSTTLPYSKPLIEFPTENNMDLGKPE